MINQKQASIAVFIIGICFLIIAGITNIWWQENAPYCCTHSCGCIHSMTDCFGSLLIPVTLLTGLCCMFGSILSYLRAGAK